MIWVKRGWFSWIEKGPFVINCGSLSLTSKIVTNTVAEAVNIGWTISSLEVSTDCCKCFCLIPSLLPWELWSKEIIPQPFVGVPSVTHTEKVIFSVFSRSSKLKLCKLPFSSFSSPPNVVITPVIGSIVKYCFPSLLNSYVSLAAWSRSCAMIYKDKNKWKDIDESL